MLRVMSVLLLAIPVIAEPPVPVGARVADFELKDPVTEKVWKFVEATRDSKATVLLFLNSACPVTNAYVPKLLGMHKRFSKKGVVFFSLYSAASDRDADIRKHVKDFSLPFTALKDDGSIVALKLSVKRLPTVIILDAGRTIRYAGRVDDQYAPGVHRPNASTREMQNAIEALLEGVEVKVPFTVAAGCKLTIDKPVTSSAITFHQHVETILQNRCQTCHRPGEAGPFSLLSFEDAKGWSAMMREVVAGDVMPPWSADAPRGHFSNDRRLTVDEKKTLLAWIDAGCPKGNAKDAPPPRKFLEGWRLPREPDEVLKMNKSIKVPASASFLGMPYQYVQVGEEFKEDRWVTAVEVRPDFRASLHHIIAFVIPPGKSFFDIAGENFGRNMLGAYVPGDQPVVLDPGFARKVEKGSKILFELHYTPMGKAGTDCSMVGLCYTKDAPRHEVFGDAIFTGDFAIPPGDDNYTVKASKTFRRETVLLSLAPHMHVRGKSFRYDLKLPGGKTEVLLNVPKYDFNWQLSYDFAKPRTIPAGSRITCTAVYDNSSKNPFNPDPKKRVRWGNQTWEEMMIGFVNYYEK